MKTNALVLMQIIMYLTFKLDECQTTWTFYVVLKLEIIYEHLQLTKLIEVNQSNLPFHLRRQIVECNKPQHEIPIFQIKWINIWKHFTFICTYHILMDGIKTSQSKRAKAIQKVSENSIYVLPTYAIHWIYIEQ